MARPVNRFGGGSKWLPFAGAALAAAMPVWVACIAGFGLAGCSSRSDNPGTAAKSDAKSGNRAATAPTDEAASATDSDGGKFVGTVVAGRSDSGGEVKDGPVSGAPAWGNRTGEAASKNALRNAERERQQNLGDARPGTPAETSVATDPAAPARDGQGRLAGGAGGGGAAPAPGIDGADIRRGRGNNGEPRAEGRPEEDRTGAFGGPRGGVSPTGAAPQSPPAAHALPAPPRPGTGPAQGAAGAHAPAPGNRPSTKTAGPAGPDAAAPGDKQNDDKNAPGKNDKAEELLDAVAARAKADEMLAKLKDLDSNLLVLGEQLEKAKEAGNDGLLMDLEKRRKDLQESKRQLESGLQEQTHKAAAGKSGKKTLPTVWHRDRARPVMARVYCGDGNALELVSLSVNVVVEGGRARTTVDHIFRNPHDRQLEGTFEYPLPTGASPSHFAMFLGHTRSDVPPRFAANNNQNMPGAAGALPHDVLARMTPQQLVKQISTQDWGKLQEGRIVAKERALEVYEEVVRRSIDPALLTYAGGNTFSGRVFPIPAKGYNRVIISYEELMPWTAAGVMYRFPLPDTKLQQLDVRADVLTGEFASAEMHPVGAAETTAGGRRMWSHVWKNQGPGGEVRLTLQPRLPAVQATLGRQDADGPLHVFARLRPELKSVEAAPFSDAAVFLLDTSHSENPDRFAVNMRLLEAVLAGDAGIKRFNVLCFDTSARWAKADGWYSNDEAGRKALFARLDGILLEGATDLSSALDVLTGPVFDLKAGDPLNLFVLSDGQVNWGEKDAAPMTAKFRARCPYDTRFHCFRIGLGAENSELFDALTATGGGVFQCFGEADLAAASTAHRRQCLTVERVAFVGGPASSDVLVAGRRTAVYPGGELVVAGRLTEVGNTTVVVEGKFAGKRFVLEQPLEFAGTGTLAARGWGEIAVASLLALNDPKLEPLAVAYCQQYQVGSRVASFLVLENEADYKRFDLAAERGKTVEGDLGATLEKQWAGLAKPLTPKEAFLRVLASADGRTKVLSGPNGAHLKALLDAMTDADFELIAEGATASALLLNSAVPSDYLASREGEKAAEAMIAEAKRRRDAGDTASAVRALSGIVEKWPARSDALRLVGYRLMDYGMPAAAMRLFARVQSDRPFEPHSYRDLARSLEQSARWGWSAVNYEIVLAGAWHDRFRNTMAVVAREEYIRMMRSALRDKGLPKALVGKFGNRIEQLSAGGGEDDLRVSIAWNTDGTDVDLHVVEPDGTVCKYDHAKTRNGGELSADMTDGYGPERYRIHTAKPGAYKVRVHYYRANPTLIAGESHVEMTVTRHAGTPRETVERFNVVLRKNEEMLDVATVRF